MYEFLRLLAYFKFFTNIAKMWHPNNLDIPREKQIHFIAFSAFYFSSTICVKHCLGY